MDSLLLSPSQRKTLLEAVARYATHVDQAASYLVGRGIDRAAASRGLLGVCAEPAPGHERFTGMLSIPYLDAYGEPVAVKFRRLNDSDRPKYDAPSGQKARLYNARVCADGGPVVLVCEGEMSALIAQAQLGVPAVGTPGTQWFDHWGRCLADFDRKIVVADHDAKEDGSDPGLAHAKKVRKALGNAELFLPPEHMDLDEWIVSAGVDTVREALGLR